VTAGNSSPITDGAAALVLMSAAKAATLGFKVHAPLLNTPYLAINGGTNISFLSQQ
jgi:acetyl-CoA acetyltransferase